MVVRSLILAVTLVCVAGSHAGRSQSGNAIWQIGKEDRAGLAYQGALEYPANEAFFETYTYTVGSDTDPINEPSCPGYLGTQNVCDIVGGRPCTDTARDIVIRFVADQQYLVGELTLSYGRYGSEVDSVFCDTIFLGTASSEENVFALFRFTLPINEPGEHAVSIKYVGGPGGNGHYIDFLSLATDASVGVRSSSWGNVKGKYEGEK